MGIKNLLVIMLAFFCMNAYGRVYKCQNEYGRVLYSNIPCEAQKPPVAGDLPPKQEDRTKTDAELLKQKPPSRPVAELSMQAVAETAPQQSKPIKYPFFYQFCLDTKKFFKRLFGSQTANATPGNEQPPASGTTQAASN